MRRRKKTPPNSHAPDGKQAKRSRSSRARPLVKARRGRPRGAKSQNAPESVAAKVPPRPSDTVSFDLTPLHRAIIDELLPISNPPGRWAALNAVQHINLGWMLRETDPSMAVFRSVTAEEEAATAVFRALQRLKYPKAEKLDRHGHLHKNAAIPFVAAVLDQVAPTIRARSPDGALWAIDRDGDRPRLTYRIRTTHRGMPESFEMVPPLELRMAKGAFLPDGTIDPSKARPVDFFDRAAAAAKKYGALSVKAHLKERANLRNRVLYAGEDGFPITEADKILPTLRVFRENTFVLLKVFLLVDCYDVQQSFARQCLLAFLKMVGTKDIEVTFD